MGELAIAGEGREYWEGTTLVVVINRCHICISYMLGGGELQFLRVFRLLSLTIPERAGFMSLFSGHL